MSNYHIAFCVTKETLMKKKLPIIALLFLVFFLVGCDTFIISPLIPGITARFHVAVGSGGYMVSFYSLFYVLLTFALGPLSDRIGRKRMIFTGMMIFSAASLATALAPNFPIILIARSATGIGAAFAAPNIWAFIGDYFGPRIRGKVTAAVASALSLGLVIGVPIGTAVEQVASWKICFYLLAALAFLLAFLIFAFLPQSGNTQQAAPAAKKGYRDVLLQPQVLYSFLATFMVNFSNFGLYTFLGYWLKSQMHLSSAISGFIFLLAGVGNLTGVFLSGILSGKIAPRKLVAFLSLILAAAFLLLPVWRWNAALTAAAIILWMMAGGAVFSVIQAFVTQISAKARGTVLAMNNGFMWMGTALGSAMLSLMIDRWNFSVAAVVCACLTGVVATIFLFRLKDNQEER
ncbi:MFS transporter [Ethanoligenens harbinense]|nr:MFS transporter [Ethanoligenens harbinense YUAN-3]QCN91860.1 MFS transporter [Ethanoligenens harbinense]